jgi:putative sigma-54 modulation protein
MEIKLEGRQVDLGDELRERITSRLDNLDRRFGPITHARISVERKAHRNNSRAEATAVINVAGHTIAVSKDAPNVVTVINELLDTLTNDMRTHVEKTKKTGLRGSESIRE